MLYDKWYKQNRPKLLNGEWNLVDKFVLENPNSDTQRGLNLMTHINDAVNININKKLVPILKRSLDNNFWLMGPTNRHITVFDMLPHNCGIPDEELQIRAADYIEPIETAILKLHEKIVIEFNGIFASPDGITIQGFDSSGALQRFREILREELASHNLENMETKKYIPQTAHVTLIKFTNSLNGKQLVETVDKLRDIPLGTMTITRLLLNISSRFDKSNTIKAIKLFELD